MFYRRSKNKMIKKSKVVVTGGAGFIGSNLVDALIERGFKVHVIDNLSGGKKENVNKKAILHIRDIRKLKELRPIIKNAEYVFHLAALPKVQYSIENPIETHEVNVCGTLNVLKTSQEAKVKRVIYSSSTAVYGDPEILPVKENMAADPKSPYGLHKYIGELYAKLWSTLYGLSTISFRYFNVYGPRLSAEGAYASVIAKFLQQKAKGKPMTITGDGKQTRDFVYVTDVVEANILAMKSKKVGKGEVLNLGSGKNQSINEIAKLIGGPVKYIPSRFEIRDSLADISLAKKLLDWIPKTTLEKGLAELKKTYSAS